MAPGVTNIGSVAAFRFALKGGGAPNGNQASFFCASEKKCNKGSREQEARVAWRLTSGSAKSISEPHSLSRAAPPQALSTAPRHGASVVPFKPRGWPPLPDRSFCDEFSHCRFASRADYFRTNLHLPPLSLLYLLYLT